jgi:hypothetical protein
LRLDLSLFFLVQRDLALGEKLVDFERVLDLCTEFALLFGAQKRRLVNLFQVILESTFDSDRSALLKWLKPGALHGEHGITAIPASRVSISHSLALKL